MFLSEYSILRFVNMALKLDLLIDNISLENIIKNEIKN